MFDMKIVPILAVAVLLIFSGCTQPNEGETKPNGGGQKTPSIYVPFDFPKMIEEKFDEGTFQPTEFDPDRQIRTQQFADKDDLLNFIKKNQGSAQNYYRGGGLSGVRKDMVNEVAMDSAMPTLAVEQSSYAGNMDAQRDYSQTNNQVEHVDEADLIKTDGEYIYTISHDRLFIIKAYPGEEAEVISTIKFDEGYSPKEIFVNDAKISVFGDFSNYDYYNRMDISPRFGMSFFNIYDIEDKEDPALIKEYKFEGRFFKARMTGGYIYFVTDSMPEYRVDYPTPIIIREDVKVSVPISDIYYYNVPYDNPMYVNIHAINILDVGEDVNSKSIIVDASQDMYMSNENIYFSYTDHISEWEIQQRVSMRLFEKMIEISTDDLNIIDKIKKTDDDILSQREKENKILTIYSRYIESLSQDKIEQMQDEVESILKEEMERYEHLEYTVLNKVNVKNGKITPVANGKVPGHINNQFSMDERDGVLRIATTLNARWDRWADQRAESTNNIYTLDSNLELLDSYEDIAEGESIYSTRFMDDRLYMVTFRQVDPFFVFDLSDPKNIEELGKLKIPGFSRYLHPYDEDIIIGLGQDATETGRQKGLKISLFDVSDVQNPEEIAKYTADSRYSSSSAEYEHRAFLFSKEKNLLVIPAYAKDYKDRSESYNGAFVFHITEDEIKLRGLIDHSMAAGDNYWGSVVERSLYIEDELYTKSESLLRINSLEDLQKIKNIELESTKGDFEVY